MKCESCGQELQGARIYLPSHAEIDRLTRERDEARAELATLRRQVTDPEWLVMLGDAPVVLRLRKPFVLCQTETEVRDALAAKDKPK